MIKHLLGLSCALALAGCGGGSALPASNTPNTENNSSSVAFDNSGENCRNFLIIAPITEANARKFVPPEFSLTQPPMGFVELADCPSGSINGVESGPYKIAEAAVFITPPDGDSNPPLVGVNSAIYLLWQLDTNAELAALKQAAGFFGELVPDIELTVEQIDPLPLAAQGNANVPFDFSPYSLQATLTPDSPAGPPLPNQLWHMGNLGPVNTFNDIYATDQVLAGPGVITIAEGSALHELFGSTSVLGLAASGIGSFNNSSQLRPDVTATKAPLAP
jgi:hypothetical protein